MMQNRIKEEMDKRGLKCLPFAKEIGITPTTLYAIYRGETSMKKIGIDTFMKIAHGLGMTADELYTGIPDKSPAEKAFNSLTAEKKEAFMRLMDGCHD